MVCNYLSDKENMHPINKGLLCCESLENSPAQACLRSCTRPSHTYKSKSMPCFRIIEFHISTPKDRFTSLYLVKQVPASVLRAAMSSLLPAPCRLRCFAPVVCMSLFVHKSTCMCAHIHVYMHVPVLLSLHALLHNGTSFASLHARCSSEACKRALCVA